MTSPALRYRLHTDLPVAFSCSGGMWRLEVRLVAATNTLRVDAVGPRRYHVTSSRDELTLRGALRREGVEVKLDSYLCTLFLRLEQLGLATRVDEADLRRAC